MLQWEEKPAFFSTTWEKANNYAKCLGNGWRLPTRSELSQAYDSGVPNFEPHYYWSSSEVGDQVWYVDFVDGYSWQCYSKLDNYYVRCVRHTKTEENFLKEQYKEGSRYLVKDNTKFWSTSDELLELYVVELSEKAIKFKFENGSACWCLKENFHFSVVDELRSLVQSYELQWSVEAPHVPTTWHEATEYAKSLGSGWRLPTRDELLSAYDSGAVKFEFGNYWSSTTYNKNSNYGVYVVFEYGNVHNDLKTGKHHVRCVKEVKQ